ncbi:amidohydrolase [Planococcus sp. YIM B11945]|uniref:amidohydrolase n=1 Tax=Planococcus sp. YIM B11945 TaxID=3435410 RepID=UPI003D7D0FE3
MNDQLKQQLVEWRRDFHQYPEQGFLEMRTASIVAAELDRLGFKLRTGREVMVSKEMMGRPSVKTVAAHAEWAEQNGANPDYFGLFLDGFTGIVADWETGKEGPVTAFRFDMDALPIFESDDADHLPEKEGFRSVAPGSMHACGHDGHTSIGLGLANLMAENADQFTGTIRIIFQPAEEGVRGAKSMTAAGVVDDVDRFIAVHLGTGVPHRHFVAAANGFLATTKMNVSFRGMASHAGAQPQDGRNALLAAASAALNIHAISRHSNGASRVNVGELHAGSGRNIIADTADMKIETRGANSSINHYVKEQAIAVIKGAAQMYGVDYEIDVAGEAINCDSTLALAEKLAEAAKGSPFIDEVVLEDNSSAGSEDATYFMERVKAHGGEATYCIVGTDLAAGHHNKLFDINEESLFAGVDVLYRAAVELNGVT